MDEQDRQDAHHPATAIRLQRARHEGDAPKSSELVAAIQVLISLAAIYFLIHGLAASLGDFTIRVWAPAGTSASSFNSEITKQLSVVFWGFGKLLLPLLTIIFFGAIFSHLIQSGTASGFKKPLLQLEYLNPLTGFVRLFSVRNLSRGIIGIPKIAIVVVIALSITWQQRFEFAQLQYMPVAQLVPQMINSLFTIMFSATASLLVISFVDYAIEWFSFKQRLRMTDQQLRDENRMQGADPQLATRRQQIYQEL